MSTNGHEDASFIEFREHAFEIVGEGSTPVADAMLCIPIFSRFTKTIALRVGCQQRLDGDERRKKLTRQEASCIVTLLTSSTDRK
jgi:hypothetical protein